MKKAWTAFTAVVFLMVMAATGAFGAPPAPQRGGVLKMADAFEPPVLNTMMAPTITVYAYATPVFNGLVMVDPTQEEVGVEKVVPSLAEKWEISADKKVYTFHLRKGVKFHDGRPFTAKDAKYSLEFFADPKRSALAAMVEMMDKVEIVDDHTIRVSLKYPHAPFLLYLTYPYCKVLPAHLANVSPKTAEFLVGTGPFKFKSRIPGKVWVYERNPDYFIKGLPYLDGVEVYPMKTQAIIDAFSAGRLHMARSLRYGIDFNTSLDKLRKYVPEAVIKMKPVGVTRGVWFNVAGKEGHKGPWQDARVRRAMTLVTDFTGSIMAGQGSLELGTNSGIVPPYVPSGLQWKEIEKILGLDKPMEERIKTAQNLMKQAGYPDGFKAELITRNVRVYISPSEFMMESWRKNLKINVDLKALEYVVFAPRRDRGEFDLMYDGTTGRYGGTPEETLAMYVSPAIENRAGWSNQEYDKLYHSLVRETEPKKRAELSVKMQKIFLAEIPFLINVAPVIGVAHRPTLHGYVMQAGHTGWACMDRMWMQK